MQTQKCKVCLEEKELKRFCLNWAKGKYHGRSKTCNVCKNKKYQIYGKKRFKWATATAEEKMAHILKMFKKNTQRQDNGCLLWTNSSNKRGYGTVQYEGRPMSAHRVSWIINKGPIPKGLLVCHHCDAPRCVEISHLFLGTIKDNWNDMVKKGRRVFISGESCNFSKLKEEQVIEIKKRLKTGESDTSLGYHFGVSAGTIADIRRGKNWKHIKI